MPDVKQDVLEILATYQKCKAFRCLPFQGSLLEQPVWIMDLFDTIERKVVEHRKMDEERIKTDLIKRDLGERIHG